jgi:hypothetical protein
MPALKGQTIRFVTPGGDGAVSEIADHRPNEFTSLRHLGHIVKGAEDTSSEAVRSWTATAQGTTLTVDQDISCEPCSTFEPGRLITLGNFHRALPPKTGYFHSRINSCSRLVDRSGPIGTCGMPRILV